GPDDLVRLPASGARRGERRGRDPAQRRGGGGPHARSGGAVPLRAQRHRCGTARAARHPERALRSQPARRARARGPAARSAHRTSGARGLTGSGDRQSRLAAPSPESPVPGLYRLGQPADRHRGGELPRSPGRARGGPQRIPRYRLAVGPGLDRNDRGARSRFHRRSRRQHHARAAALRRASGMAGRARRARTTVSLASGAAVRAPYPPRGGGGGAAPTAPRYHAVRYALLGLAVIATLGAAVLLGPANVPLRDLLGSPIFWQ